MGAENQPRGLLRIALHLNEQKRLLVQELVGNLVLPRLQIGARGDRYGVAAGLVGHDRGDTGCSSHGLDAPDVDISRFEASLRGIGEGVAPDRAVERDLRPIFRGGDRLVCALAPRLRAHGAGESRFAGGRQGLHVEDQIKVDRAEYQNHAPASLLPRALTIGGRSVFCPPSFRAGTKSVPRLVFVGADCAATGTKTMAKAATIKIKLLSSADTGHFYVTKKNARTKTDKLSFKKYDPVARKHVEYKETKIK